MPKPKRTAFRDSSKTAFRVRTAVLAAAGLGASVALGSGVALAAEAAAPAGGVLPGFAAVAPLGHALHAQGETQLKVAEKEKQDAAKRAEEVRKRAEDARKEAEASRSRANAWVHPVEGYRIGQPFGKAGSMWANKHSGQDLVVDSGTPVKAVHAGTVVKAGGNGGGDGPAYGNAVVIKHADGQYSQYAHMSSVKVSVGQRVMTGQDIGLSGSTGNSSGPHLHFEIRTTPDYGSAVDPVDFMVARGGEL
ncbi:M23 family metallopeptidase [Streptomyces sp. UNOB3_S3]|uniref:M23 family metallopeptidase n=1 Tax=Streptomyces sp. UNOB3_S3 TaxID=2871682 RepID=UPI001E4BF198|nr:peptidoglycan DD-metalloendopeptidase family protein [Streptomyces sp. UNOB3_S3]MCC3777153.1 peptidoglycan DD-metalloendopeptidase family protein [Streptomyces sp. UNOB3_S3]